MIQLICKKIDDTDYYYFATGHKGTHLLAKVHCDDMDYFVGKDAYSAIHRAVAEDKEAILTIVVSIRPPKE